MMESPVQSVQAGTARRLGGVRAPCLQMLGEEDKTPPDDKYDAECSVHPSSASMLESCYGVPWRVPR
jgi:hypothetical protein